MDGIGIIFCPVAGYWLADHFPVSDLFPWSIEGRIRNNHTMRAPTGWG